MITTRRRWRPLGALAACGLALGLVPTARAASVTDLGNVLPLAINASGQVLYNFGPGPAVWSGGSVKHLDPLPLAQGSSSTSATAAGLNAAGTVVGTNCQSYQFSNPCQIVTWPGGATTPTALPLNDPREDANSVAQGLAIDDRGDIGGLVAFGSGGSTQHYGVYAPRGTGAQLLSDQHAVIAVQGTADLALGVFDRVGPVQLSGPDVAGPADTMICDAAGMAPDGAFVGYGKANSACTSGNTGPVLQLPGGQPQPLALGGAAPAAATVRGLNSAHTVVGGLRTGPSTVVATMWPPGGAPVDLNTLLPAGSGWKLQTATAINDGGDIVGFGTLNGAARGFVLRTSALSAKIRVLADDGSPYGSGTGATGVGATLSVEVTLSVAATAKGAVTNLSATPPLAVAPGSALTPLGGPTPGPPSGALAPGQAFTYTSKYRVAAAGDATVSVQANGTDADGLAVQATAAQLVHLAPPLAVAVTFEQNGVPLPGNRLKLDDTDTGPVPQDVTARVTVTNVSTVEQDGVMLQPPDLSVIDPNSVHLPFPVQVIAGPTPGAALGNLAPGATSAPVTFTLLVDNNGDFTLRELATSADGGTGATTKSLGAADLHVLPTALLRLRAQVAPGTHLPVVTGGRFLVQGTVTNLSQTHSVDVDPVTADAKGNGGGGDAVVSGTSPTADGFFPPVNGKLKPGESRDFTGVVQTVADGGTRTTLTYAPTGRLINDDGSQTDLTPAQIRLTKGSSPLIVPLDDTAPPVDDPDPYLATWNFGSAALENLQLWAANSFHAITDVRSLLAGGAQLLVADGQAFYELVRFVRAATLLDSYFRALTPAERQHFADEVAIDVAAANDACSQFRAGVDQGVQSYFLGYETAMARGDLNGAATILGGKVGSGLPDALSSFLPNVILGKVARGLGWGVTSAKGIAATKVAQTISLADKLYESKVVIKAAKRLKDVKVAQNLLRKGATVLRDVYGINARDSAILAHWAKKRGLLIAVRSRQAISLKLRKLGALLKPEAIKLKNVDEIDVKFLGYRGGPHGDLGTVVLKKPDPIALVKRRLAGEPREVQVAALKRYGQRFKEYKKHAAEYKALAADGKIDIGFKGSGNGAGFNRTDIRRFELEQVGKDYYRVKLGDPKGVLKRITGDIDIVAITRANGEVLSAAERAQLYEDLLEAIGMQHGETLSWLLKGDVIANAKAQLLADHLAGGELLAVFGPDGGCRAAYFDPHVTVFNRVTKDVVATFIGAWTGPAARFAAYLPTKL